MTRPRASRPGAWPRAAALIMAAALAASCGGGKIPPSHYYSLAASPPAGDAAEPASPEGLPRLEVGIPAFDVDPPYNQERIVYRGGQDALEVGYHVTHRWAAPLSRMLPSMVGDHLMEVAGGFVSAGPPSGRPLDARLEGRLMALEEVLAPESHYARARMRLTLRSLDGDQIWSEVVEGEAAVGETRPDAIPAALRRAVLAALGTARPALTGALLGMARSRQGEASQP